MASVLHTLLVEWYASSSHTITEQLLISIIAAISRIIEKKNRLDGTSADHLVQLPAQKKA